MQVDLHVLEHQVDVLVVLGADHVVQLDYVLVVHLLEDRNLAVSALGVRRVLKCVEDFF
jgi:ADP-glucose pyrophosphorylase